MNKKVAFCVNDMPLAGAENIIFNTYFFLKLILKDYYFKTSKFQLLKLLIAYLKSLPKIAQ